MRNLLLSLPLILMSTAALAKPAELSVIKSESPYGAGSLTKLIFHAYDAEIWTDSANWSYNEPFALSLTYRMAFTTNELVDRTFKEMKRIHPANEQEMAKFRPQLETAFPSVKDGDRITALFSPKEGVSFYYNGKLTQKIASVEFARQFFDIWLSDKTSEPGVRAELLKQ